jgi:hypothetical protein
VADNRLAGIETSLGQEEMLLRVARGEVGIEDAIRERLGIALSDANNL